MSFSRFNAREFRLALASKSAAVARSGASAPEVSQESQLSQGLPAESEASQLTAATIGVAAAQRPHAEHAPEHDGSAPGVDQSRRGHRPVDERILCEGSDLGEGARAVHAAEQKVASREAIRATLSRSELTFKPPAHIVNGLEQLHADEPRGNFDPRTWAMIVEDSQRLAQSWACHALAFDWTVEDLYGVHPTHGITRTDTAGLALLQKGKPVLMLNRDYATVGSLGGAHGRIPPSRSPDAVPIWTLPRSTHPTLAGVSTAGQGADEAFAQPG
jgi:hypothetical protein